MAEARCVHSHNNFCKAANAQQAASAAVVWLEMLIYGKTIASLTVPVMILPVSPMSDDSAVDLS